MYCFCFANNNLKLIMYSLLNSSFILIVVVGFFSSSLLSDRLQTLFGLFDNNGYRLGQLDIQQSYASLRIFLIQIIFAQLLLLHFNIQSAVLSLKGNDQDGYRNKNKSYGNTGAYGDGDGCTTQCIISIVIG